MEKMVLMTFSVKSSMSLKTESKNLWIKLINYKQLFSFSLSFLGTIRYCEIFNANVLVYYPLNNITF